MTIIAFLGNTLYTDSLVCVKDGTGQKEIKVVSGAKCVKVGDYAWAAKTGDLDMPIKLQEAIVNTAIRHLQENRDQVLNSWDEGYGFTLGEIKGKPNKLSKMYLTWKKLVSDEGTTFLVLTKEFVFSISWDRNPKMAGFILRAEAIPGNGSHVRILGCSDGDPLVSWCWRMLSGNVMNSDTLMLALIYRHNHCAPPVNAYSHATLADAPWLGDPKKKPKPSKKRKAS